MPQRVNYIVYSSSSSVFNCMEVDWLTVHIPYSFAAIYQICLFVSLHGSTFQKWTAEKKNENASNEPNSVEIFGNQLNMLEKHFTFWCKTIEVFTLKCPNLVKFEKCSEHFNLLHSFVRQKQKLPEKNCNETIDRSNVVGILGLQLQSMQSKWIKPKSVIGQWIQTM